MKKLLCCSLLFTTTAVYAGTSATVSVVSDYLFNGVSQTGEDPALQASFDWAGDSGMYAGVWGSNVDFADGTDIEADVYVGYYTALTDTVNLDVGIAQYTYHGGDGSSNNNYPEAYAKFNVNNTNFNFWYTWDYFGLGGGHAIAMVTQSFPIDDAFSIDVGIDYSKSLDADKWEWEPGDTDYIHWHATANYTWQEWNFSAGYQDTDIDSYGDARLLVTVSKTFSF